MVTINLHQNKLIVKVVETVGRAPGLKLTVRARVLNTVTKSIYKQPTNVKKHLPKTQRKNPTVRAAKIAKPVGNHTRESPSANKEHLTILSQITVDPYHT